MYSKNKSLHPMEWLKPIPLSLHLDNSKINIIYAWGYRYIAPTVYEYFLKIEFPSSWKVIPLQKLYALLEKHTIQPLTSHHLCPIFHSSTPEKQKILIEILKQENIIQLKSLKNKREYLYDIDSGESLLFSLKDSIHEK